MSLHLLRNDAHVTPVWDYMVYSTSNLSIQLSLLIPLVVLPVLCYCIRRFVIRRLEAIQHNGPLAKTYFESMYNFLYHLLTGRYLYYAPYRQLRHDPIYVTDQLLTTSRFTLYQYCKVCRVFGHDTTATTHDITSNSIYYAKLFKICNSTKHQVQLNVSMKADKNQASQSLSCNTRFALLPRNILATHKYVNTASHKLYINHTYSFPHLFIIGYDDDEHCMRIANRLCFFERITIYGDSNLSNVITDHNIYPIPTLQDDTNYFDIAVQLLKAQYAKTIFKLTTPITDPSEPETTCSDALTTETTNSRNRRSKQTARPHANTVFQTTHSKHSASANQINSGNDKHTNSTCANVTENSANLQSQSVINCPVSSAPKHTVHLQLHPGITIPKTLVFDSRQVDNASTRRSTKQTFPLKQSLATQSVNQEPLTLKHPVFGPQKSQNYEHSNTHLTANNKCRGAIPKTTLHSTSEIPLHSTSEIPLHPISETPLLSTPEILQSASVVIHDPAIKSTSAPIHDPASNPTHSGDLTVKCHPSQPSVAFNAFLDMNVYPLSNNSAPSVTTNCAVFEQPCDNKINNSTKPIDQASTVENIKFTNQLIALGVVPTSVSTQKQSAPANLCTTHLGKNNFTQNNSESTLKPDEAASTQADHVNLASANLCTTHPRNHTLSQTNSTETTTELDDAASTQADHVSLASAPLCTTHPRNHTLSQTNSTETTTELDDAATTQANNLSDLEIDVNKLPTNKQINLNLRPTYGLYRRTPTKSFLALTILSIITVANSLCTNFVPTTDPSLTTQPCLPGMNLTQPEHLNYVNHMLARDACFGVAPNTYTDLLTLQYANILTYDNVWQLDTRSLMETRHKPLIFTQSTGTDLQLMNLNLHLNYVSSVDDVKGPLDVLYSTATEYNKLATKPPCLVYLYDVTEYTCDDSCIIFKQATRVKQPYLTIKNNIKRKLKSAPNGLPIFVNPLCYDTCYCLDQPKQTESKIIYPSEFFAFNFDIRTYHQRLNYALDNDLLEHQSFSLQTFLYRNKTCLEYAKTNCIFKPTSINLETCQYPSDTLEHQIECAQNDEFCASILQYLCPTYELKHPVDYDHDIDIPQEPTPQIPAPAPAEPEVTVTIEITNQKLFNILNINIYRNPNTNLTVLFSTATYRIYAFVVPSFHANTAGSVPELFRNTVSAMHTKTTDAFRYLGDKAMENFNYAVSKLKNTTQYTTTTLDTATTAATSAMQSIGNLTTTTYTQLRNTTSQVYHSGLHAATDTYDSLRSQYSNIGKHTARVVSGFSEYSTNNWYRFKQYLFPTTAHTYYPITALQSQYYTYFHNYYKTLVIPVILQPNSSIDAISPLLNYYRCKNYHIHKIHAQYDFRSILQPAVLVYEGFDSNILEPFLEVSRYYDSSQIGTHNVQVSLYILRSNTTFEDSSEYNNFICDTLRKNQLRCDVESVGSRITQNLYEAYDTIIYEQNIVQYDCIKITPLEKFLRFIKNIYAIFAGFSGDIRYNFMQYFHTIRENFNNYYGALIKPSIKAYRQGNICEFLAQPDTQILYEDCIHDKLDTIFLINAVYRRPSTNYRKIKVVLNQNDETVITQFSNAIGYEYKGLNYIYYRPLFTSPYQTVPAFFSEDIKWCYTAQAGAVVFNDFNTHCIPYITGVLGVDQIIVDFSAAKCFGLMVYTLMLLLISAACHSRSNTMLQLIMRCLVFLFCMVKDYLRNAYFIGNLLSYFDFKFSSLMVYIATTSWIVFSVVQVMDHIKTLRNNPWDTRNYCGLFMGLLEILFYIYFYFIPGAAFDGVIGILTVITLSYVIYRYYGACNWERSYVTLKTAARDWCLYRDSLRVQTDEYAKQEIGRLMTHNIVSLTPSKIQQYNYLLQCYQNTVNSTFDPNHAMQVKKINVKNLFLNLTHDGLINQNQYSYVNQNLNTNPSYRFRHPHITPESQPHIKFTASSGSTSSLYGAVIDGVLYIERHLFGNDRETFLANYDNGRGLYRCNISATKYDLEKATINKTLIQVPLYNRTTSPFRKHPEPLAYVGPIQMYIGGKTVHGFMQNGRMDIKTYNGDCGGMIFTGEALFLGLHCAGSPNVAFKAPDGKPNIWTNYKYQTPSALMVTLNSEINLDQQEDYDFKALPVIYNHPLRDIKHTLQTLQFLTNPNIIEYPYDARLYRDFGITSADYVKHGYFVDYDDFVLNFEKYTTTTIGSNGMEYCLKYGVKQWHELRNLITQSDNAMVRDAVHQSTQLIVPPYCHTFYLFYLLNDFRHFFNCFAVYLISEFSYRYMCRCQNKYLRYLIYTFICVFVMSLSYTDMPIYAYFFHNWTFNLIFFLIRTIRYSINRARKSFRTRNQSATNTNERISVVWAKTLGNNQNLCNSLCHFLKILKNSTAFAKLEQVVNQLDDLQADWCNRADPDAQLKSLVDEIFTLYPTLFVLLTRTNNYEQQIDLLTTYISDNGDFDLDAIDNLCEPFDYDKYLEGLRNAIRKELNEEPTLATNLATLHSNKELFNNTDMVALLNNEVSIAELINCLTSLDVSNLMDDRELITKLGLKLSELLKAIRNDTERFQKEDFVNYYLAIKQSHDHLQQLYEDNKIDQKLKNYYGSIYARLTSQLLRGIHVQEQTNLQAQQAEEKHRRKEAAKNLQNIQRIRKIQKRNQVIAYAIHQMVQLCVANRFVMQNESVTTENSNSQDLLSSIIEFLGFCKITDLPNRPTIKLTDNEIANQALTASIVTTLWSGSVYSAISSPCGDYLFRCTADHNHGYYNCNKSLFKIWYEHTDNCQKCRENYSRGKHPSCPEVYSLELISETRRPNFVNFSRRYRSCPACLPCDNCMGTRDPQCTSNCTHYTNVLTNRAFLAAPMAPPSDFVINSDNINCIEVKYQDKTALKRYSAVPASKPLNFRRLMRSPKGDPTGIYYISNIFGPGDVSVINALINSIMEKLQGSASTNQATCVTQPATGLRIVFKGVLSTEQLHELQATLDPKFNFEHVPQDYHRTNVVQIFKNAQYLKTITYPVDKPVSAISAELNEFIKNNSTDF